MQQEAQAGGVSATAELDDLSRCREYIRLVSVDPARNRARFYVVQWQQTLAGEWALLCTWGRIGARGRVRVLVGSADDPLETLLRRILTVRLRHGYRVARWR